MDIDLREYVTIQEACKLLRKSDKQVRRYIKDERLEVAMFLGRYLVKIASIEKLLSRPVQIEDTLARQVFHLHSQIEEISSRLDDLASQLQALSDELAELKIQPLPAPKVHELDKATRQPSADLAGDEGVIFVASADELPEDVTALYLVADSEGIKRHTLADFVRGRAMPHYGIRDPKRPREIARFVSQAQKQAILEAHRISRRPRKQTL